MSTKESLFHLIQRLNDLDDDEHVDLAQSLELITDIKHKVDSYKFVVDQLSLQESFWDERLKVAQAKRKTVQNNIHNLKKYLSQSMLLAGSNRLEGQEYSVRLSESYVIENLHEVTDADKVLHSEFVTAHYVWNKKAIAKAIVEQNPIVDTFARVVKNQSVRFYSKVKS